MTIVASATVGGDCSECRALGRLARSELRSYGAARRREPDTGTQFMESRIVKSKTDSEEPGWDWTATVLVVLGLVLLALLTFEIWAPHFGSH